jgi:hypothetical protein
MMRKTLILIISLVFILISGHDTLAMTTKNFQSLYGSSEYYDPSQTKCSGSGSTGTVTPGTGAPDGATFPNLDPNAMANAINIWITQQNPNSELSGLGSTIVASAKNSNINPFIMLAIASQESSLASPSDWNTANAGNPFGREALSNQPNVSSPTRPGILWYKWTSVKASIDYTAAENQNAVGGGDEAAYLRNQYGSKLDNNDLLAFMEAYAPPSENNTTQYIANIQSITNALINLTTGGVSGSSSAPPTTAGGCGSGGVNCNASSTLVAGLSTVRQNVVCIARQELATWQSQPGYPWNGQNSYSETGYLKYSQNRPEEWCADFASWVYDQAKYPLTPDPNWNIAYVPHIQAVGEQNQNFHWHPAVSGYTPKPGDLAIYGANHVNIVVSVSNNTFGYIGGDQGSGPYPGGSIVSTYTTNSPYDQGVSGYVSPD